MLNTVKAITLCLLLSCVLLSTLQSLRFDGVSSPDPNSKSGFRSLSSDPQNDLIARYGKLSLDDFRDSIKRLGQEKRFDELKHIYSSRLNYNWEAVAAYAAALEGDSVVGFCKSFEIGSRNWFVAVSTLSTRPKADVITYLREFAASGSPHVRAQCYILCRQGKWADFLEDAKKDLENPTELKGFGAHFLTTVGDVARDYVIECSPANLKL